MAHSTVLTASSAMASDDFMGYLARMLPQLLALFALQEAVRQQPPTPELACAFEKSTATTLREFGRVFVAHE